ncbi:MAG: ParB N-terminal domain-containing protein [Phycisphaerales bacterium]|nr:ParB N-terminal domain-containing protein [Phycisphaerales bacterium]
MANRPRKSSRAPVRSLIHLPLNTVRPSPENDSLYRPTQDDDLAMVSLAESIRARGILEPLVISSDLFIISGHRRFAAARLAGLQTVPVRIVRTARSDDLDAFTALLREHNRQRVKGLDELLREEVVEADPTVAHAALLQHCETIQDWDLSQNGRIDLGDTKRRSEINKAKWPMLKAVIRPLDERKAFWPLSVRAVHYALLNDPPPRHASKPRSRYCNDSVSCKALCDLLTRARHEGDVPWEAIDDPTRPIILGDAHDSVQSFVQRDLDTLFCWYRRNLQRSQPAHIEIVAEKLTVRTILEPVARRYTIPLTIGRGFASTPPRKRMAERFRASGKDRLILSVLSDFDPDGGGIASSFARSMRDDFHIRQIEAIKVTLRHDQIEQYAVAENCIKAKRTSSRWPAFAAEYGEHQPVYELEAVRPNDLQMLLMEAADCVLDVDLFNREVDAEAQVAAFLETARRRALKALEGCSQGDLSR